jgi:hypothetical protein
MIDRLRGRESALSLERHFQRNVLRQRSLETDAPSWVHRVDTNNKTLDQLALESGQSGRIARKPEFYFVSEVGRSGVKGPKKPSMR